MILDVRTIPEGHSVVSQTTDLSEIKSDLPALLKPIECRAEVERKGAELYIHLTFSALLELECARCLGPVPTFVEGEMRLVAKEQHGKHGVALDDESVDFYFDSVHLFVDLSPALYEEITIALPLKPLCKESCEGILIDGKSVVEQDIPDKKEIDPRWEALKKFKQKN